MPTLGSGTNQFVPHATADGAAVETPSNWAADLARPQGFQNGVLLPQKLNTPLRQSTFIASVLAQFMADFSGNASNDDGNLSNAETNLVAALQTLFQPFGVYFITDTGSANAVVGTSAPAPTAYSQIRLIVFKKMNLDNTGAVTINLWTLGAVQLLDNTGAALTSGALKASSFYLATPDGANFRVLGGTATYTNVTDLTANSGDGVEVNVSGAVNWKPDRGTHDNLPQIGDLYARERIATHDTGYQTRAEFLADLSANLPFLTSAPASGPGTDVGQFVVSYFAGGNNSPAYYGFVAGSTAVSGSAISSGSITISGYPAAPLIQSINQSGVPANFGFGSDNGPWNAIQGTLTGTWRLAGWFAMPGYIFGWGYSLALIWVRVA